MLRTEEGTCSGITYEGIFNATGQTNLIHQVRIISEETSELDHSVATKQKFDQSLSFQNGMSMENTTEPPGNGFEPARGKTLAVVTDLKAILGDESSDIFKL